MNRNITCCFTGHRPEKLPWRNDESDPRCVALKKRLAAEIQRAYSDGYRHFICGMARGADFNFCEELLAFRKRHADVTLEAALPCEEQANCWAERDRNRYFLLVSQCNCETMVQHRYSNGCMQRRDRYMVDHSSRLIAVYDGMLGGTMYTLTYAMRGGVDTVILGVEDEPVRNGEPPAGFLSSG